MIIVRYADDIVLGFEHEADARRFLDAMRERLGGFALTLHPDKTRLIAFGRFAATKRAERRLGKPETFNFLGFTFICGKDRQGKSVVREIRTPRSVGTGGGRPPLVTRWALSNERPYRDPYFGSA